MTREEYESSLYLAHHGVKGQKWGERRYQNEDGSYKSGAEGRYDHDPQSNGHRTKSSSKSESSGKGKKIAKGVAIGLAGAAVGVGVAYAASKYIKSQGARIAATKGEQVWREVYSNPEVKKTLMVDVDTAVKNKGKALYSQYISNTNTKNATREYLEYLSTGAKMKDLKTGEQFGRRLSTAELALKAAKAQIGKR